MPSKKTGIAKILTLSLSLAALTSHTAKAANATWTGATDATWSDTGNWTATPVPGTGNTATFNNAGGAVDTIDVGGVTIGTITATTNTVAAYTFGTGAVGSQTLTFDSGGAVTLAANAANNQLFNSAIAMNGGLTLTNSKTSGTGLIFAGNISSATAGAKTLTVNVSGNATTEISGNIVNGSGTIALFKNISGTLIASGADNTFTGGISIQAGTLEIKSFSASVPTITLGGSGFAGTLRYTGGALTTGADITLSSGNPLSNGTIEQAGTGLLKFTDNLVISGAATRTLTLQGSTVGTGEIAGNIGNSSAAGNPAVSVTKGGSGTWTLTGSNTYSGATTVNAGTLVINGSIAASTTTVNGGLLGGSGTTGAVIVNDAGAIGAGNSIGTLTTGDLALNDSAEFVFEFNIASASSVTADLINSSAFNLDTDNTAVLSLSNLGLNLALNAGTVLTLVDYSTWNTGTFAGLADDSQFTFGANTFKISYNGVSGLDSAVTLEVVPEPSTVALVGLGLASVLFRLRRRAV